MIRIATQDDLETVVELVTLGAEERGFDVSKDTLTDSVQRAYYMAPTFLAYRDDKPVGVVCMTLGSMPWSQEPYLTTIMVYILPEYRKYGIIGELYDKVKKYAKLQGIQYRDVFLDAERIDGKRRLIQATGLQETGISIIYEAK